MDRAKCVILDDIKPCFVARILPPKKAKKKILNSQLASDPWRFPAFLLVETIKWIRL